MSYVYGPMQLRIFRGLALTAVFPAFVCLLLAAANLTFYEFGSVSYSLRGAIEQFGEYYRSYPMIALAIHGMLFIKGAIYRPRYRNVSMQIFIFAAVAAATWFAADKMGMQPGETFSDFVSMATSGSLNKPYSPRQDGNSAFNQDVASSTSGHTLATVKPIRQNLLNQKPIPKVDSVAHFNVLGKQLVASGHIGQSPALYVLNLSSHTTAAAESLARFAQQPCVPSTSTVNGDQITGCDAVVTGAIIGNLALPKFKAFFTSFVKDDQVLLGSNVAQYLKATKHPEGGIEFRMK